MNEVYPKKDMKSFNSFYCGLCERTFKFKSQLTIHKRTHTQEKALKCKNCNKSFTQKNSLTRHM